MRLFVEQWALEDVRARFPLVLAGWRDIRLGVHEILADPLGDLQWINVTGIWMEPFRTAEPLVRAYLEDHYTNLTEDTTVMVVEHTGLLATCPACGARE